MIPQRRRRRKDGANAEKSCCIFFLGVTTPAGIGGGSWQIFFGASVHARYHRGTRRKKGRGRGNIFSGGWTCAPSVSISAPCPAPDRPLPTPCARLLDPPRPAPGCVARLDLPTLRPSRSTFPFDHGQGTGQTVRPCARPSDFVPVSDTASPLPTAP